ncbi:MAG: hypothetical protein CL965_05020, partial [Euryarchaeota archaeon]|nr:hypothetical protein [Euryarchaeota archaeon]
DDHSDEEGDHDDHSDEEGDHDDEMCHNTDTHENYESTEEDCEAAGHVWMHDDDHGDHGEGLCHNTDTHENYEATDEDCEAAGHIWMGHEEHHDLPEIHADRVAHSLSFPEEMICYDINTHTVNMSITTETDCHSAGLMWTAADSGPGDDDHDDHDDDHLEDEEHHEMGALVIHIEEEGDYGFALPNEVEMLVVMGEGGHDDHDHHDDHSDEEDDHDDHSDEEDDHDDGGEEIVADDDEEAFDYDPHSWLDPISFNEQLNLVLEKMITVFPDATDVFTANAETYSAILTELDSNFEAAFGEDGSCVTGGYDKTIVANHNAYSYISVRYDIDILTVHGLDPEGEPSPGEVAEVVEQINEKGITTLFVEEYTDSSAVQSIVEETGVSVKILYTMEMQPSDPTDDYLSMMNKNLNNMVAGIGC